MAQEEVVRIFVGTDERQAPAEEALKRSVLENTSAEVEFTWMRAGDPGWGSEWNRGVPDAEYKPKSGTGWGTWFSCFRLAIPSLCEHEGRAIYLDSDMIVLGDIAELWNLPIPEGKAAVVNRRKLLDVMLLDCSHPGWPAVDRVKKQGMSLGWWRRKIGGHLSPTLPDVWDCRDQVPPGCKLLHFTTMPTQPWRPWPESMTYREHPSRKAVEVWEKYSRRGTMGTRQHDAGKGIPEGGAGLVQGGSPSAKRRGRGVCG